MRVLDIVESMPCNQIYDNLIKTNKHLRTKNTEHIYKKIKCNETINLISPFRLYKYFYYIKNINKKIKLSLSSK